MNIFQIYAKKIITRHVHVGGEILWNLWNLLFKSTNRLLILSALTKTWHKNDVNPFSIWFNKLWLKVEIKINKFNIFSRFPWLCNIHFVFVLAIKWCLMTIMTVKSTKLFQLNPLHMRIDEIHLEIQVSCWGKLLQCSEIESFSLRQSFVDNSREKITSLWWRLLNFHW